MAQALTGRHARCILSKWAHTLLFSEFSQFQGNNVGTSGVSDAVLCTRPGSRNF
jgi:hypothetical protein